MKKHIKEFISYVSKINPTNLSASITFYLLFIILPLLNLINNVLGILQINNSSSNNNIFSVIVLFGSIIWISYSLVKSLNISSHIIYNNDVPNINFKSYIKYFLLIVILIFLIIIEIITVLFLLYFINTIVGIKIYILGVFIEFILQFISVTVFTGILTKYILPVHISFKRTIYIGMIMSIIWYLLFYVYNHIIVLFINNSYNNLYGIFSSQLITIYLIYLIVTSYLYVLLINYYIAKKWNVIKEEKQDIINTNKAR